MNRFPSEPVSKDPNRFTKFMYFYWRTGLKPNRFSLELVLTILTWTKPVLGTEPVLKKNRFVHPYDLVSVDTIIEERLTAEPINEYVQSCDIVAFNKICKFIHAKKNYCYYFFWLLMMELDVL